MNRRLLRPGAPRRLLSSILLSALACTAGALPPSRLPRPAGAPVIIGHHELGSEAAALASRSILALGEGRREPGGRRDYADRAIILCWHSFLGDPNYPTDFSLAELGRQLDALAALGYRFPSLDELLYGRIEGRLNIVVTLDDGHRSIQAAIDKVFAPRGIAPAVFVYPAVIGSTSYSIDGETLGRLAEAGLHVGAHGYHHLYVTDELAKREPEAFAREIYKAKERTELKIGEAVLSYAYPFGLLSPAGKAELARAGYAYGFTVGPGFVYADAALNDAYELPRLVVTREGWGEILALLTRNALNPKP